MHRSPLSQRRPTGSVIAVLALVAVAIAPGIARAADVARPDGRVSIPTQEQVFTTTTVTFSGTATDDVGIAAVHLAIRDRATSQWLRLDGTWGAQQWWATTLTRPRATWTRWSVSR